MTKVKTEEVQAASFDPDSLENLMDGDDPMEVEGASKSTLDGKEGQAQNSMSAIANSVPSLANFKDHKRLGDWPIKMAMGRSRPVSKLAEASYFGHNQVCVYDEKQVIPRFLCQVEFVFPPQAGGI